MKLSVLAVVLYLTESLSGCNNLDTTANNMTVSFKDIESSEKNIEMAKKNVEILEKNIQNSDRNIEIFGENINELFEANNDLSRANNDLSRANNDLSRANNDSSRANNDLSRANNDLSRAYDELSRAVKYPCQCIEGECGCCTGSLLANFNWNVQNRMCSNITYYPEDFEFHVRFIFNDNVFYQRRMSGKNPRPLCANIPRVQSVKMCIVFSNVYVAGRNLHMCLSMETKWRENTIYSRSFDCIRVGTAGVALLKPEEGGGLPPPKPVEENLNATSPEDYDAVVASEGDEIQSA